MKRFYCTVCKRQKRVQKWPIQLDNAQSEVVTERRGECNYHTNPALLQKRVSARVVKSLPVVAVKSSRKGGNR